MKYFFLLIVMAATSSTTFSQRRILVEDEVGQSVTIKDACTIIVIKDLVCSACILELNEVFKKGSTKGKKVYILYDTFMITQYQRIIVANEIKKKFNHLNEPNVVFLPRNAQELISNDSKFCMDEKSPYLMFFLNDRITIEYMCYDQIFKGSDPKKSAIVRIRSLIKQS